MQPTGTKGVQKVASNPEQTISSQIDAQNKGKSAELTTTKATDVDGKKEKEAKKLTIGQKIKKEAQHYWDGTKLLATEVKISSRLALKMAAGYELSRREHRQVSAVC